ncbi:BtpA/SgcQ family protein (plasmid) [Paroceanicella profunda]|uniref:BtpA/SgcQ family protein n=1 Tax=Paroceanicella profunda TaxID=2579971 RepID=A0A5B8FJ50_9RHOB|nr:BtpA/SgcQ family protein [Paroceanicella profunda]QDL93838.1 BtpA/SgcQ family protein [Paroceanicella profunda]
MKTLFESRYNTPKFLIGMVHTLALPGAPLYDRTGGMRRIVAQAKAEARILRDAGFHSVMYCNESDMPYESVMQPQTIAAMTEVIAEAQDGLGLPHGVNMLIDPVASVAIAHATGGEFVRCFLTGSYVGDLGAVVPDGARALRLRAELAAENIALICNVTPGFSINLDTRPVPNAASGAVFLGLADAVCVSGPAAGVEADLAAIEAVAAKVPDTPVVVGTGVSAQNINRLATAADAFIIGTSIKIDQQTLNAVDPARADALVRAMAA